MTPLKVVAFFDGRLGHEKQTHGVVNALARRTPIEIVEKRHVTNRHPCTHPDAFAKEKSGRQSRDVHDAGCSAEKAYGSLFCPRA
jgi:hypothetical protein